MSDPTIPARPTSAGPTRPIRLSPGVAGACAWALTVAAEPIKYRNGRMTRPEP
jgi:hypothetical protein